MEAVESVADTSAAADLFALLGNETRVRIVAVLYDHWYHSPETPCLPFSALYARVDGEDSGQFNYHLRRLREGLVERRADGYALTPLGICLAQLIADEKVAIA